MLLKISFSFVAYTFYLFLCVCIILTFSINWKKKSHHVLHTDRRGGEVRCPELQYAERLLWIFCPKIKINCLFYLNILILYHSVNLSGLLIIIGSCLRSQSHLDTPVWIKLVDGQNDQLTLQSLEFSC